MLNFDKPINTRIAPSPTGNAHIGLVRTAYHNYLAARSTGGKFLVRIDDTDATRSDTKYTDDILATFDWLGLDNDGVVHQSDRYDRYTAVAEDLLFKGLAVSMDNGAVCIDLDSTGWISSWTDLVAGTISVSDKVVDTFKNLVILRSDGSPTYHFASCVDDIDMDIDLIIRGTDHIDNTAKHVNLFRLLGLNRTILFAHVGLIFYNGKKINKRDGVASMDYYKNYNPDAILNAVLKLGWSHPDANIDKALPLINKDDAIGLFPIGKLKASKATLDLNKLDWLNKRYERLSN